MKKLLISGITVGLLTIGITSSVFAETDLKSMTVTKVASCNYCTPWGGPVQGGAGNAQDNSHNYEDNSTNGSFNVIV